MGEENTEPINEKEELEAMTVEQLKTIAKEKNIVGYSNMNKADLVTAILTAP